jgi:ABC-type antimicrobial peptide transport system permease subunit
MPIVPKLIGNIGEQTVLPAFIHFCLLAFRLSLRVFRGVNRISGDKKQSAQKLSIKIISINSGLSPAANLRSAESSPEKAYSQKTDL